MTRSIPLFLRLLLAAALVSAAASCQSTESTESVSEVSLLVDRGQYDEAVRLAEQRFNEDPTDPAREDQYRLASVAVLLHSARTACFEGDDETALDLTRQALALAPEEKVVRDWNEKMEVKLADRSLDEANSLYAQERLDDALAACEEALAFNPGDQRVEQLMARLLVQINYRRGMSENYYEKGVHLVRDYWLEQARTSFAYAREFHENNERAVERQSQVERQLSLQRSTLAKSLEDDGLYFAARNEFRLALLIDEHNTDAQIGFARADREAEAAEVLRKANRLVLAKEFDEAEEMLRTGRALTEVQLDDFDGALAGVEEGRFANMYDRALAFESDLRYEEAIEAYEALVERASYYRDAFARIDTLKSYVETAERLYAEADAAATDEEKRELLRRILIIWPEYRDVPARLAALGGEIE